MDPSWTIGIDLSAQSANTAACVIEWGADSATVVRLRPERADAQAGLDDTALLVLIDEFRGKVGIDSPFGWPASFVDQLVRWQRGGHGRGTWKRDYATHNSQLRFRETDRHVIKKYRTPQPVSASYLGATAMRCAGLLNLIEQTHHKVDRAGVSGRVAEVYPAAALAAWKLPSTGYKGDTSQQRGAREALIESLTARPWLSIESELLSRLDQKEGHYLDALVCALVARAVATRRTEKPKKSIKTLAEAEGWIHLPRCELDDLIHPA